MEENLRSEFHKIYPEMGASTELVYCQGIV